MAVIDVVKYNGTPDVFAWKFPREDLSTWTQLIVNESQEAVLYKDGVALDLFKSGKYVLDTNNIPILREFIKIPFGGRTPFAAEVWFVNKATSLDVKWGTPTPIQIQDPKYKIFTSLRSYGQFGIRIADSKKFLQSLVGTLFVFNKENIVGFFRGVYLTRVKDIISSYLVEKSVSALEINAHLNDLSEFLKKRLVPEFEEYGIELINFYVNDINIPEDDESVKKLKSALAKKAEMDIVGYNYTQERSFNTLEGAAKNPGSVQSGFVGAGIGLGMGAGMGGAMGNQFADLAGNMNIKNEKSKLCPGCGKTVDENSRFCSSCGYDFSKDKSKGNNGKRKIKCSNCGFEYENTVKFCPECGNKYNPCPKCGADLKDGAEGCSECDYMRPKPCPKCGCLIEDGNMKFCPECGASLVKRCPNCNTEVKDGQKFCFECGTKL